MNTNQHLNVGVATFHANINCLTFLTVKEQQLMELTPLLCSGTLYCIYMYTLKVLAGPDLCIFHCSKTITCCYSMINLRNQGPWNIIHAHHTQNTSSDDGVMKQHHMDVSSADHGLNMSQQTSINRLIADVCVIESHGDVFCPHSVL